MTNIEGFSFKKFQEEFNEKHNIIIFKVAGTFMGKPFKEAILKKNCGEGYSKNGILCEIAEIVRAKRVVDAPALDEADLLSMDDVKALSEVAQRLVDALLLPEDIGYFVVTLRCKHKFARGNYVECPMCGEIVR